MNFIRRHFFKLFFGWCFTPSIAAASYFRDWKYTSIGNTTYIESRQDTDHCFWAMIVSMSGEQEVGVRITAFSRDFGPDGGKWTTSGWHVAKSIEEGKALAEKLRLTLIPIVA